MDSVGIVSIVNRVNFSILAKEGKVLQIQVVLGGPGSLALALGVSMWADPVALGVGCGAWQAVVRS